MDTQANNQKIFGKIIVGVNTVPLSNDGGGMKQHFIDTFTNIVKLAPWTEYNFIMFYLPRAYDVILEIEGLEDEIKNGNIQLIQIEKIEEIWEYRNQFNFYLCPLNNFDPKITDKPSIAILADIQEQYFPQFFKKADLLARRDIYPDILASSYTAVTISEFSKATFIEKFGIKSEKIKVIYPSISHKFKKNVALKKEIDVELPEKYLLYPANSYLHKNHINLLKAFAILKQKGYTDLKLVLTGDTKFAGNDISKQIKKMGLEDLILDLGLIKREVLDEIFRRANALIFPSLFEGFGIPIIEAAYLDKPILCSDDPCLREIANGAAYYFDETTPESIADCILSFSEGKFRDLPLERAKVNEKFDSDINASSLLEIIKNSYQDFNEKRIQSTEIADIIIVSLPFNLVKINKTINSIKALKLESKVQLFSNIIEEIEGIENIEIKSLAQIQNIQTKTNQLLLFAGQEINANLWNCKKDVIYTPLIKAEGIPKYIIAQDMWQRFIKPSKILKQQYIRSSDNSKAIFDPTKSFIEFSLEDYLDYENDNFAKALLMSRGFIYRVYSYLRKRKKLFLLPIIKPFYKLLRH